MKLEGKTAVITGTSKGIGLSLSRLLLGKGCRVIGLGMNPALIDHPGYYFIKTDAGNIDSVNAALDKVFDETGREINILINNAGLGYFGKVEDIPVEQWHEMFSVNVNGMFYTCRRVAPHMKELGYGHIINIASTAALEGMPMTSGYCATKWAVKGFSESLWRELRDSKIKVTCIYPGSTKTDFFRNSQGIQPHDYMLMPDDVASMIVWALESPDNFHQVNLEVRPLQPKGPAKPV